MLAYIENSATDNDHRSEVISYFTRVSLTSEYSRVEQISAKVFARNAEFLPLSELDRRHVTLAILPAKLVHHRRRILSSRIPFKKSFYDIAKDPSARSPYLVIRFGRAICNVSLHDF